MANDHFNKNESLTVEQENIFKVYEKEVKINK